jgi:hypothetical protein
MSSTATGPGNRALAREWLAVRIIVIGGFAIALIAAIVIGIIIPQYIAPRVQRALLAKQVVSILSAEAQICTAALGSAKNFGIVPQYGQLASARLEQTTVQGRYACLAATHSTKYVLIVDLVCRNFKDPRCASLYNVSQTDGAVLYQRQR